MILSQRTGHYFSDFSGVVIKILFLAALINPLPLSAAEMQKIAPRQFVVDVEKPGEYSIQLLFAGPDDISWSPDADEWDRRFEKKQVLYEAIHNDVEGRILIYDFSKRTLFHEIRFPPGGGDPV